MLAPVNWQSILFDSLCLPRELWVILALSGIQASTTAPLEQFLLAPWRAICLCCILLLGTQQQWNEGWYFNDHSPNLEVTTGNYTLLLRLNSLPRLPLVLSLNTVVEDMRRQYYWK